MNTRSRKFYCDKVDVIIGKKINYSVTSKVTISMKNYFQFLSEVSKNLSAMSYIII